MRTMAPATFGLSARICALHALFCMTPREDLNIQVERADAADIRVTALYRPNQRGGFLVRVRPDPEVASPFVHLAVVESGTSDQVYVFEWVAPWAPIQATTEFPPDAVSKKFEGDATVIHAVVDWLLHRTQLTLTHRAAQASPLQGDAA